MPASNRYKGTALTATWTQTYPTSASAITFNGIKDIKYDSGISIKKESADGDLFPTAMFNDYQDPTFTCESINPYMAAAITPSLRGTFAYSIADAANGVVTSGGGKSFAITNSYLMGVNIDHTYREFGKGSFTFGTISADGTTSPVTIASL